MPPVAKKPVEPEGSQAVLKPGAVVTILGARGTYADVEVLHVADTHLEVAGPIHMPPYAAVIALPWANILTISVVG